MTLEVLKRSGGLVAIAKPPGLLVIPGRTAEGEQPEPCARDLLAGQLGQEVWVCHRIDRDTSGVLLFATDAKTHREASMAFEQGKVKKLYVALVQGRVRGPLDVDLALVEARKRKMRVAVPGELGKPSRTLVRPREVFEKASLVEAEPLTGRQHQIRVHLRAKGHPLLVDHQYGRKQPLLAKDLGGEGDEVVLDRTPLHAERLELGDFSVVARLPADMTSCLELLRGR